MAGLLIPQHGVHTGKAGGRVYPPATRPEEVAARPATHHIGFGQLLNDNLDKQNGPLIDENLRGQIARLIDENLSKQHAFRMRHETVPASFIDELAGLLASPRAGK